MTTCLNSSVWKKNRRGRLVWIRTVLLVLLVLAFHSQGWSQQRTEGEEVPLLLQVPRMGSMEISALVRRDEALLLVSDLFDVLKINHAPSSDLDSLSGFFVDPKATYLIDWPNHRIQYEGKTITLLPEDMVRTETGLYLKTSVFAQIFDLNFQFHFRNLSLTLSTQQELPLFRQLKQEQLRKNLNRLVGKRKADTTLSTPFSWFHLGMADWMATSTHESATGSTLRANVTLGATVMGGEVTLGLNYYSPQPLSDQQQFYRWRSVNNDRKVFRQITLGNLSTPTLSSIFAPLQGIQLTNTPTYQRKAFATYRYTGTTEPDWMVELYVNHVLVNYKKADASGFYAFDIPIIYGNSTITLKFYGPWGEENTREETLVIPYNFLPQGQLEYSFSAAVERDDVHSRFARTDVRYGLSPRITLGTGMEYHSTAMLGKPMPFFNASGRLGASLILSGEYAQGVRTKGSLNYQLPRNGQLELSFTHYKKGQTAILYNYLQERKIALSLPVQLRHFSAFSKLSYNGYILPKSRFSNLEYLLSMAFARFSTNFRTLAQFSGQGKPVVNSNLSLSMQLPYGLRLSPQVAYQFDGKTFSSLKAGVEKRISDLGFLSFSYESNRLLSTRSASLGLRFNFSAAQTFLSTRRENKQTQTTISAKGSLIYEVAARYLQAVSQPSVGKGGFIVLAFLDLNGNGRRDQGEPKAPGLNLRLSGGRVERSDEDTTLRISGLEAYAHYFLEFNQSGFDNIAWKLKYTSMEATVMPNRFQMIEVPVSVLGEASGMVYLKQGQERKGLSRMIVNFYDSNTRLVAHTLTESDGFFSFLGLAPGHYTARLDSQQLHQLHLGGSPDSLSFTLATSEEGAIADGFSFALHRLDGFDAQVEDKAFPQHAVSSEAFERIGHNNTTTQHFTFLPKNRNAAQKDDLRSFFGKSPFRITGYPSWLSGVLQKVDGKQNPPASNSRSVHDQRRIGNQQRIQKSLQEPDQKDVIGLSKNRKVLVKHQTRQQGKTVQQTGFISPHDTDQRRSLYNQKHLKEKQRKLMNRNQQALKKLRLLIQERQALIQRQRALLQEIKQLRYRLLQRKIRQGATKNP